MKSLLLASAMILAAGTAVFAQGGYWVVGNGAISKCDIVTSNPGGNTTFGSGPYRSLDDAKLARSTIGACPKVEDQPPAGPAGQEK